MSAANTHVNSSYPRRYCAKHMAESALRKEVFAARRILAKQDAYPEDLVRKAKTFLDEVERRPHGNQQG